MDKKLNYYKWGLSLISIFSILLISLSVFTSGFRNWDVKTWFDKNNSLDLVKPNNDSLSLDFNNSTHVTLTAGEITVSENSVSKTLTAVVYPENAYNKAVDWSIDWNENNEGESAKVSDYITITPSSDGSLEATVTAYKGFEGSSFLITVTTRMGGLSASCLIKYIGVPSTFEIVINNISSTYDNNWSKDIYNLEKGQSYYIDLEFDNVFGNVTSDYEPNFQVSGISYGQVNLLRRNYTNTTDNPDWVFKEQEQLDVDLSFANGWGYANYTLLTYGFEDGKFKINALNSIDSIKGSVSIRGSKQEFEFVRYTNYIVPYLELTITDINSNLSQKILVRTVSPVENVNLDNNELLF